VLPKVPSDVGNVTFTISNSDPPRTNLVYPKISPGVIARRIDREIPTVAQRRTFFGELIYTVSKAQRSDIGNTSRQYELGQVTDFGEQPVQAVDPMLVNSTTEVQHNTNIIDYTALGLSSEEQTAIDTASTDLYVKLETQLNELKQLRANTEQQVNSFQKLINDTNRALDALQVIASNSDADMSGAIAKLEARREDLFRQRAETIALSNEYADQANALLESLRQLAVVVK